MLLGVNLLSCRLLKCTQEPTELAEQKGPSKAQLGSDNEKPHGDAKLPDGKQTFGGYDCKFVEPHQSLFQTICPICLLVLRDPYQSQCCNKNFCHSCIQQVQAENQPCPTCRKDNFELFQNKSLECFLKELYVSCRHSKDGCKWIGKLRTLQHHLSRGDHSGELEWYVSFGSQVNSDT